MGVSNPDHYRAMAEVYDRYGILIEPHGAVAWRVLDTFLEGNHDRLAAFYETADPGKFPEDVQKAIGITPTAPKHMAEQAGKEDRVYSIDDAPDTNVDGSIGLSHAQYGRVKEIIMDIISN
jgi:threonine synthase